MKACLIYTYLVMHLHKHTLTYINTPNLIIKLHLEPINTYCPVMCNFASNLQCNSTLGRCEIGKYMFQSQFADVFLTY